MNVCRSLRANAWRGALVSMIVWTPFVMGAAADEVVEVVLPSAVDFEVMDVSVATTGSPNPVRVGFQRPELIGGNALRVSVRADAGSFTAPGGQAIQASGVSWTTAGSSNGTGWNGTLTDGSYTLLFEGDPNAESGHADFEWTLAAPGAGGLRAGSHQLTIRWKVESVKP